MQAFTTNLFDKRTVLTLWFQLKDYAAVFEKNTYIFAKTINNLFEKFPKY